MKLSVSISVNGRAHQHEVEPRLLLVHFLRDVAGLTGTKIGCDTSQCGACTVLIDGIAVKSCTCLTAQADGCSVTTIEGLADGGQLHALQDARGQAVSTTSSFNWSRRRVDNVRRSSVVTLGGPAPRRDDMDER